jgi:hypothetical protein
MTGPGPDYWSNWALANDGVYFFAPNGTTPPGIEFLDFKTRRVSHIAKLERPSYFGLTVSPDGTSLVYSQWDRDERGILVMKNFR